ncbi:MAG: hypothetical protein PVG47_02060 [Chromatiales bacterium]|jgi:hypothetical protein
MNKPATLLALAGLFFTTPVIADSVDARCDIYPRGSDHASKMIPCRFYQAQGHIVITRDDGVVHDLMPVEGAGPGNYRDKQGHAAYRQSGLGDQGQIFRLKDESVYVYWDTAALNPSNTPEDNYTYPFTTKEYDATTRLRCKAAGDSEFGNCPAGVLRMDDGQGSVVIQNQLGEIFTINFMKEYVNATNRQVKARLEGDNWVVTVENGEVYEVPLGLIQGG